MECNYRLANHHTAAFLRLHRNALERVIFVQGPLGLITAKAGLLDANMRRKGVARGTVDKDIAGLKCLERLCNSTGIMSPQVRGKAHIGINRLFKHSVKVTVGLDSNNRAKNLLTCAAHGIFNIDQQRIQL